VGPFDRFNDRAKRVLALAQDEAIRFNHNYIGPEHLLLALVREGEGAAARVLNSLNVGLSTLRTKVEAMIGRGNATTSPSEIVLSPEVKKIIHNAIEESRKLGHSHVGTEHLLLGLAQETEGIASKLLAEVPVTLDEIREKVTQHLGHPGPSAPPSGPTPTMGPFDRFNDRAKRVLALAQAEAIRLKHNYIGTEHLLLGLVHEGESVAARVLDSLGIELSKVRTAVEFIIGVGAEPTSPSDITLSPRTKKVIEFAIDEARLMGQTHVGPEHLLLGLVREGQGIASGVIESLGVTLTKVRQQLLATLGQTDTDPSRYTNTFVLASAPFNLFDDVAKRVLVIAEEEARGMRHNWVGTEHLLIALARHGMARTLHQLGVTLDLARAGVFAAVAPREEDVTEVSLTPRMRTLLGKAIMLAAPGGERVRPHHLLLALVDDQEGVGAQILTQLGATADKVRAAIDKESKG
jgi:ATP-dependent Clp protease ATP-binding subunit ClpA